MRGDRHVARLVHDDAHGGDTVDDGGGLEREQGNQRELTVVSSFLRQQDRSLAHG